MSSNKFQISLYIWLSKKDDFERNLRVFINNYMFVVCKNCKFCCQKSNNFYITSVLNIVNVPLKNIFLCVTQGFCSCWFGLVTIEQCDPGAPGLSDSSAYESA